MVRTPIIFHRHTHMAFDTLASAETVEKTAEAIRARGLDVISVATKAEALAKIKERIPAGASVMNGASRTLEEIGYIDYLKAGEHGWSNLHADILAETDPARQAALRKQSVISDFYLGSVHAVAETGELVIASNTGSQLPHVVFTSPNVIFVVSTKKITPSLADALVRLNEHVVPLEDARMKAVYGMGTTVSKIVIFQHEHPMMKRKVQVLFVNEDLGF